MFEPIDYSEYLKKQKNKGKKGKIDERLEEIPPNAPKNPMIQSGIHVRYVKATSTKKINGFIKNDALVSLTQDNHSRHRYVGVKLLQADSTNVLKYHCKFMSEFFTCHTFIFLEVQTQFSIRLIVDIFLYQLIRSLI
jgi:hypothetical protein